MPVTAGAALVKQAQKPEAGRGFGGNLLSTPAELVKQNQIHLFKAIHTTFETSPFLRTFVGTQGQSASLARTVTHAFVVTNPPAARLFKQAAHPFLATQAETATVSTSKAQAFKVLSASSPASAVLVRAKVLPLAAGYNTFLPPGFGGTSASARLTTMYARGHAATATSATAATKTLQLRMQAATKASNASAATLTAQAVAHLVSLAASVPGVAALARLLRLTPAATQDQAPVLLVGRAGVFTATQTQTGFLTTSIHQGIGRLTLVPSVPGTIGLAAAASGTLTLTPIT